LPKTELARNTRQVINSVLRGQPAVVESYGQPEVAIIDIVDYYIVRAVMRYYAHQPEIDPEAGLPAQEVEATSDSQERFDLVLAHYTWPGPSAWAALPSYLIFPGSTCARAVCGSTSPYEWGQLIWTKLERMSRWPKRGRQYRSRDAVLTDSYLYDGRSRGRICCWCRRGSAAC
jgi:hypothetical protein